MRASRTLQIKNRCPHKLVLLLKPARYLRKLAMRKKLLVILALPILIASTMLGYSGGWPSSPPSRCSGVSPRVHNSTGKSSVKIDCELFYEKLKRRTVAPLVFVLVVEVGFESTTSGLRDGNWAGRLSPRSRTMNMLGNQKSY